MHDTHAAPAPHDPKTAPVELPNGMKFREPGIYFGLDEQVYHNDPALGSSDMKALSVSPPDFWFDWKMNPLWEPSESTPSQILGSAIHKMALEGETAFRAAYQVCAHSGSTREGKAERAEMALSGKQPLKEEQWRRAMLSGQMIRSNPEISEAFAGGCGSEVSIFWTDNGIRKKCRIDYLKQRASVDLKSVANQHREHFPKACYDAICRYRYDVQAEHYRAGRMAAVKLYAEGRVHGPHDGKRLASALKTQDFAWVFIFYQTTGAPLTHGEVISLENPIYAVARDQIEKAERNYHDFASRFGLGTPWVLSERLKELSIDDLPPWYARG